MIRNARRTKNTFGSLAPLREGMGAGRLYRFYFFRWSWVGGEVMLGLLSALLLGIGLYLAFLPENPNITSNQTPFEDQVKAQKKERMLSDKKSNRLVRYIPQQASRQKLNISHTHFIDGQEAVIIHPYNFVKTDFIQHKPRKSEINELPTFKPTEIMLKGPVISISDRPNNAPNQLVEPVYKLYDLPVSGWTRGEDRISNDILQSIAQAALIDGQGRTPDDNSYARFDEPALASENASVSYGGINLTPVNVIDLTQYNSRKGDSGAILSEETLILTENGKLYPALKKLGIEAASDIIPIMDSAIPLITLRAGWKLRVGFIEENAQGLKLAHALAIYKDDKRIAAIKIKDDRTYEVVSDNEEVFPEIKQALKDVNAQDPITLYESLFETGHMRRLPPAVIHQLVAIFVYDVDFNRTVSTNDHLEVMYTEPTSASDPDSFVPEIVYASMTHRNAKHTYYLFRDRLSETAGYFDESGQSAQKFLMRKPLQSGVFRSGFGFRRHPILKKLKMHNGLDWAAKPGTPIFAAGNGTVTYAKWKSGYGYHVRIQHANGYETTYSHMRKIDKNIVKGTQVSLGQTIGSVGSSGLSTGPHLHYEVLINGKFVDPAKIRVPRGETLSGTSLNRFHLLLSELRKGLSLAS